MRRLLVWVVLAACSSPPGHQSPDGPGVTPDAPPAIDAPPVVIPIKHVVIVVKENHTFDNYFGSFPGADGISQIQTSSGPLAPPRAPARTSRDLSHTHSRAPQALAGGRDTVACAT